MGIFSRAKKYLDRFVARSQTDAVQMWGDVAQNQARRGNHVRAAMAFSAGDLAAMGPRSALEFGTDVLSAVSSGALAAKALGSIPAVGGALSSLSLATLPMRRAIHLSSMHKRTHGSAANIARNTSAISYGDISRLLSDARRRAHGAAGGSHGKAAHGKLTHKLAPHAGPKHASHGLKKSGAHHSKSRHTTHKLTGAHVRHPPSHRRSGSGARGAHR